MRMRVWFLVLLSGLRIQRCCKLWHRWQMWFRSALLWLWHRPAYSSELTPSLGTSICHRYGPKRKKKKLPKLTQAESSPTECDPCFDGVSWQCPFRPSFNTVGTRESGGDSQGWIHAILAPHGTRVHMLPCVLLSDQLLERLPARHGTKNGPGPPLAAFLCPGLPHSKAKKFSAGSTAK